MRGKNTRTWRNITMFIVAQLLAIAVPFNHLRPYCCEVQTFILEKGDAANRYPDLVVLRDKHVALTQNT